MTVLKSRSTPGHDKPVNPIGSAHVVDNRHYLPVGMHYRRTPWLRSYATKHARKVLLAAVWFALGAGVVVAVLARSL